MLLFQFAVYGWAALLFTTTRLLPVNYFVSGYQVPSTTVIQNRALTSPNGSNSRTPTVSFANVIAKNEVVDVSFTDGSTYRFHSLWLRDACRDAHHVAARAGEVISLIFAVALPRSPTRWSADNCATVFICLSFPIPPPSKLF